MDWSPPNRWFPVAQMESRALLESKGVWLLAALLPVWTHRPDYRVFGAIGTDMTVGYLQYAVTLVLPLAVIFLGYRAIAGERESGSIKFLLGLPLTRRELFTAKVVGRTVGIAIPTFLGLGITVIVGLLQHGFFSPLRFVAVLAVTLLYVVALISIVLSVSAIVTRPISAAGVLVIGLFVGFELFWDVIAQGVRNYLQELDLIGSQTTTDGVFFLLMRSSPTGAYNVVTNWILGVGNSADQHNQVIRDLQRDGTTSAYVVETTFHSGDIPIYLHEAGGLIILLIWIVVPLIIGTIAFTRGDYA